MGDSYKVEGYWDCSSCGAKGIRGRYRECPNCGKPRGEDVQFYLKEFGREYAIEDDESDKPDWFCEYCSSYNPDKANQCLSCGADRSGRDYSQMRDTTTSATIRDEDGNGVDDSGEISNEEREHLNWNRDREDKAKKEEEHRKKTSPQSTEEARPKGSKWNPKAMALILGLVVFVAGIAYYLMPKSVDVDVTGVGWERSVHIDQWQTVSESDWDVPQKARVYKQQEEIHHHDHVLDHYEDYYETVSEEVVDHYKTVSHKRDMGNGKFEITEEKVPVYKTVTHKEKRQRPVYVDVPIYRTKYYYKLERWKPNRTVDTSGSDKNPYFGEFTLAKGVEPYNVGEEKVTDKVSKYTVTGKIEDEEKTLVVDDESWWQEINVGDRVHGKVTHDGHLVKDE